MTTTTKFNIDLLEAAQAQKHLTVNTALYKMDALLQCRILDRDLTSPPGSPSEGDSYLVAASATGAWSGQDGNLAIYTLSSWEYITILSGYIMYVVDEDIHIRYNGTTFEEVLSSSPQKTGWQDFDNSGSTQSLLVMNTFVQMENDGAGPNSTTAHKIPSHGNIWDTSSDQFDFSDLSVGDLVTIRADMTFVTSASNDEITVRLQADIGGTPFELTMMQTTFKSAGTHSVMLTIPFYIGSTGVRDNPAEIQVASDTLGDTARLNGLMVTTTVV